MDNLNEKDNNILPQPQGGEHHRASHDANSDASSYEANAGPEVAGGALSGEKAGTLAPPQGFSGASQPVTDDSSAVTSSSQAQATAAAILQDVPDIADDNDLIEKEWVNKVKQIVDQTKHDPHNQNKQIVHLRADYLKKRYNKDIKMDKA